MVTSRSYLESPVSLHRALEEDVHLLAPWAHCRKVMWGKVQHWQQSQFCWPTLGKGWVYITATSFCLSSVVPSSLLLKPHHIFQKPLETTVYQIPSIPGSLQSSTTTVTVLMRNLNSFETGICPMGKIQSNNSIQETNTLNYKICSLLDWCYLKRATLLESKATLSALLLLDSKRLTSIT